MQTCADFRGSKMILFTGQRRSAKWNYQLRHMAGCWRRGETSSMLTSRYTKFDMILKGKCSICGKETSNYQAQSSPLKGYQIVLRNNDQEIIAKTNNRVLNLGIEYAVLFICPDHSGYWKSFEYVG